MYKKFVFLFIAAVVAFFAGAILTDYFPTFASLFLFLELGIGGVLGFLYHKELTLPKMVNYETELAQLKAAITSLKKEKVEVKKAAKKIKE